MAVASVLEARLRARGYSDVRARPHQLGFTLEALPTTAQAKRFVADVRAALAEPFVARDPATPALKQALAGLRARTFLGPADAAAAACSGELGLTAGSALPDVDSDAGQKQISGWLAKAFASDGSALAAVGPASWLEAAAESLEASGPWPHGSPATDTWPERDTLNVDFVSDGPRRLSVAFRVSDAAAALTAADQLGRPNAPVALRMAALSSGFRLERASATVRPRGACVRVDLSGPRGEPGPDVTEVARALLVVDEEIATALVQPATAGSAFRTSDPRDAAAAAAWRALSMPLEAASAQRTVSYVAHQAEQSNLPLAGAVEALRKRWSRSTLEVTQRDESGQAELWMLAASPCGTTSEGVSDAGQRALFVRALAREASGQADVELEPWIASDGIGLLAHAGRRDAAESAPALARRVGSALGRALLSASPSGTGVAAARTALLEEIGTEPRPGYWLALDALSPGRPAWLEPRGTFAALTDTSRTSIDGERHGFLRGPLRVALLVNATGQAEVARDALERWLRSERLEATNCAEVATTTPRVGEFTLSTGGEAEPEGAYLAVAVPSITAASRSQAEATLWLLNRTGGWLERALAGLTARAQARLVGGSRAAGIVVRVVAAPGAEASAVAQVRGLFDRLAKGAATTDEVTAAARESSRLELESSLDPRRRVVDLWRGAGPARPLDLASLRAFHARLGSANHAVVFVRSRQ